MSERRKEQKHFIGYEYKEIFAEGSRISLLLDGYENFGWEIDEKLTENGMNGQAVCQGRVRIRLRRNRKIVNKMELTRLQRNFEACVSEVDALERSKFSSALIYALVLGLTGTAFMAGSTFAVVARPPHILLSILLAVPGFLGWVFPYFLYRKVVGKQTEKVTPLIEAKYDEIYEICEKGNRLLH